MRKILFFAAASIILLSTTAWAQTQPNYPHYHFPGKGDPGVAKETDPGNNGSGSQSFSGQSGTGANINVVYHRINWTIDPNSVTKTITGTVVTYFKTIAANVATITLDLNTTSFNNVSLSVTYHGTTCTKASASNILTITLPSTIVTSGTLDSLVVNYSGIPPIVNGAAEGYQSGGSGTNKYTMSLSESYEDRDWWPCKADMQDKIDSMDIIVTVPWNVGAADTFWVASNGKLIDSTITGSNRTFHYKTRYPIASYLVAVSVAKFTRYYRQVNVNGTNMQVAYYILRNTANHAGITTAMDKINLVLTAFSTKFGDYPFKLEKHGFYDGLLGAGGMEHQTFSGIQTSAMTDLQTLAHELMHQWFGDNVSFSTWNDLWLAEGFARYSESLCGELVPSLGLNPYTIRNGFKTTALGLGGSAWIPNASMSNSNLVWGAPYGSTVYERGCMIVSMLRSICGDTKFFQALTNYQTNLAGKSATTDTLKNYFNAVLGQDISQFFTDYVGGSGSATTASGGVGNPINPVNWNSPAANKLVIQMGTQTRTGGTNVSYFHGPVVVHFANGAAGSWTKDTTIVFYDWGGGSLSYAGNGLSNPIPGNILNYNLSFTPTNAFYDDSARTMSTGSVTKVGSLTGYTWTGATNSTWNTTTNWTNSTVVPSGAQVTVATTGSQPVLPGTITVGGLFLNAGTTLNIGNNTLIIGGPVTGAGTITGSANSNITINDSAGTINFDQTSAATRSLNNLTISSGSSATLGSALDVYGTISLSTATLNLNSKNLTLKSTSSATARIADLTGSTLSGATNVTAERYLADVGHRAWRLLGVPVTGSQTIKQAWQENGVNNPNLGTNITSPLYNGVNGFDASSGSSSILTHNQGGVSGPSWTSTLPNTGTTLLTAFPGYMVFVRGDRNATGANSLHAPTVLRATGTIRQGTQSPITVSATGTGYTLVGNPYPSPVDFEAISGTANLAQNFYVWDATLTGNYGLGGYRLVQRTAPNTYQQTPVALGGSPTLDPTARYIHSGQAFFLKATGSNASVVFTEACKSGSVSVVNPFVQGVDDQQLIVNLLIVNAGNDESMADGLRIRFNDNYLADISDDVIKLGNYGENISSYRQATSFIVEQRPTIGSKDTIFLRITNTGIKNYRFQVGTFDFVQTNLIAYLQDDYLGTSTLLDLAGNITTVDFSVTADPASAASNRFRIVFSAAAPLPLSFTSVKAYQQNLPAGQAGAAIAVEWKVASQLNIKNYEVEKSTDGLAFGKVATVAASGANGSNATYNWLDANPLEGDNFYRIRSVGDGGETKYSQVVNVRINKGEPRITIYPNPVTNSNLSLQFNDMEKGVYLLRLVNSMGQVVFSKQLSHNGGSAAQSIGLGNNITSGSYRLEIIKPNNGKVVKNVNIEK